jgi:hypothetical protein
MASITLPRPSRKGNLANAVAPKPVNKNRANGEVVMVASGAHREEEKDGEQEEGPWWRRWEGRGGERLGFSLRFDWGWLKGEGGLAWGAR